MGCMQGPRHPRRCLPLLLAALGDEVGDVRKAAKEAVDRLPNEVVAPNDPETV